MIQKDLVEELRKIPESGMGYSKVLVTLQNGQIVSAVAVGGMVMIPASDIVRLEAE